MCNNKCPNKQNQSRIELSKQNVRDALLFLKRKDVQTLLNEGESILIQELGGSGIGTSLIISCNNIEQNITDYGTW